MTQDSPSSKELLARLRRYLPYLGTYADDVREAIAEIERLRAALESTRTKTPTGHNAWLDLILGSNGK